MLQLIISVLTTLEFPELENFISGQKRKSLKYGIGEC